MLSRQKTNILYIQTRLARERISVLLTQLQLPSFNEENLIHLANLIKFGFKPDVDANLMVRLLIHFFQKKIILSLFEKRCH
jgi:hypothetical protein